MHFEQNLTIKESSIRYGVMMIPVIIGGVLNSLPLMLLGMPIFITAITGFCPLYYFMGKKGVEQKKTNVSDF